MIVHEYEGAYQPNGNNIIKHEWKYKLLNTLEFSSARKRMSVIVREPEELGGRIVLMCKGADSIVAERLTEESVRSTDFLQTQTEVDKYANEGLRTLFLAHRYLDEQTYGEWNAKAQAASCLI